jgi:transcriptional regulator with XRE-family HTH domain
MNQSHTVNGLLDTVIAVMGLKNNSKLAIKLQVPHSHISRLRRGIMKMGPTMLLRIHEATGIPISDLRKLMGDDSTGFFDTSEPQRV